MLFSNRRRRAFTLMEILVVLTLVAAMTAMAGGVFTGATNYFRSRGSAETLLWDVRRIQEIARARGIGPVVHGVKFYKGQWDFANNAPTTRGWSYLVYGVNGVINPPDALSSLSPDQGRQLVALAASVQLVQDAVSNRSDIPPGTKIEFDQNGLTVVCGGCIATTPPPDRGKLDLFDAAVGWFRLRVVQNKFIGLEYSPL